LEVGVDRSSNREATFIKAGFAKMVDKLAADLFGEIIGLGELGWRPAVGNKLLIESNLGFNVCYVTIFAHSADDIISPRDCSIISLSRIVARWRLGQTGNICGLGDGQRIEALVEIVECRGGNAISTIAEKDLI